MPGRLVLAAHAVHQKNAAISRCLLGSVSAPAGMAYSLRPVAVDIGVVAGKFVESGGAVAVEDDASRLRHRRCCSASIP